MKQVPKCDSLCWKQPYLTEPLTPTWGAGRAPRPALGKSPGNADCPKQLRVVNP